MFPMGDWSHPNKTKELREVLRQMSEWILEYGHKPCVSDVLHNVVYEEVSHCLWAIKE